MGRKKKQLNPDQTIDLQKWMKFYNENGKFPHNQVLCTCCKKEEGKFQGVFLKKNLEKFGSLENFLTKWTCKSCRQFEVDNQPKPEKEKKEYVQKFLTREEMEERAEEIRKTLPKINVNRPKVVVDLAEDPDWCKKITDGACFRPDIFLKYKDCDDCRLYKNCKCSIRILSTEKRNGRK